METQKHPAENTPPIAAAGVPAPWRIALLAALALLVPGLALAVAPLLPSPWHVRAALAAYLFVLLGLLAGWIKGFPRWSYPYVGYGLVAWGWRAWLGLGAAAVLALLVTRSVRPVAKLLAGFWRDPIGLSFALFGTLPIVMQVLADEVSAPLRAGLLASTTLLLTAGVLLFMLSTSSRRRIFALLGSLSAAWLLSTVILSVYWHGPSVAGRPPLVWYHTAVPMLIAWLVAMLILLLPVMPSLLRRGRRTLRAA